VAALSEICSDLSKFRYKSVEKLQMPVPLAYFFNPRRRWSS